LRAVSLDLHRLVHATSDNELATGIRPIWKVAVACAVLAVFIGGALLYMRRVSNVQSLSTNTQPSQISNGPQKGVAQTGTQDQPPIASSETARSRTTTDLPRRTEPNTEGSIARRNPGPPQQDQARNSEPEAAEADLTRSLDRKPAAMPL